MHFNISFYNALFLVSYSETNGEFYNFFLNYKGIVFV